ncbi:uncharacterized protein B0T15DRAFT_314627 [Chaetomium strumarium]|uniref:Uncharacterized protein n=1 Tax=Chaetomium strumarium TaxID=1170767 RepID=A0AAJ0GMM6_9PEZI|nr:hypothetical protein B0T15DRAFT_314627 [Chaetomium strumarium]
MGLANAVIDLVKSFGELLNSVVGTAYALVHSFVAGLWGLVAGVLAMFGDLGKGAIDFVEGVGRFVVGNAALLGVAAAGFYAYKRFIAQPQAEGRRPAVALNGGAGGGKKTN